MSKQPVGDIEQETQDLLCAEDGQEQAVQHPDIAIQPANVRVVLFIGELYPVTAQDIPEIQRDNSVHQDRDQVVGHRLPTERAKGATDSQPGDFDERAVNEGQKVLDDGDQSCKQDGIEEDGANAGVLLLLLPGRGALGPQPVDQEERHADQDQRQRLGQRIRTARDGFIHDRAEQADQAPENNFNADKSNQVKIKAANGFHCFILPSA
jgi:hypothetical protein